MKKVIKLTENDLERIVRRTIEEQSGQPTGQTPAQPTKQGTITIHVPQLPNINKQDLETYLKSPEFQKLLKSPEFQNRFKENLNKVGGGYLNTVFKERTNENDLSRIVRRALNEQLRLGTTSNPNTPSSTRTNNFYGKTVNLYKDIENKIFLKQAKIISDLSTKYGEFGQFKFKTNLGELNFYCDRPDKLFIDTTPNNEVHELQTYNKNFTTTLKRDLCTKSSGGSNVPKADFASNNQKPNSDFA